MEEDNNFSVYSIPLLCFLIVFLLYRWSVRSFSHWKTLRMPYVKPVPLFGNSLPFALGKENYPEMLARVYRSLDGHPYGGYFEMREPVLMIRDPDLIGAILTKDFNYFHDRSLELAFNMDNRQLNPFSANLFTLKGDRWKSLRSRLTSVFTTSKLNAMIPAIERCAANVSRQISEEAAAASTEGSAAAVVEIREMMIGYAFDVISACVLGLNCKANDRFVELAKKTLVDNKYFVRIVLLAIDMRLLNVFRISDFPKDVTDFFANYIRNSIEQREKRTTASEERKDFLQTMIGIKNDCSYDENDIAANAFLFFLGGYETTASALTFCLHELANNVDVQDKLRDEIKTVGQAKAESIKDFKYLDMVMAETFRKYAVMPTLLRVCTKDYVLPTTGDVIPEGTKLAIPNNAVHTDSKNFQHPEKFDPDRFIPENKAALRNGTYIAFGDGPRYCIGMRFAQLIMKIVLIEIISNFTLQPTSKTKYKLEYRKRVITTVPENGVWINVKTI